MPSFIRFTVIAAALAGISSAVTLSVADNEVDAPYLSDQFISGMNWTGSVFVGAKPITLFGDTAEIYQQILNLNPEYAPRDSAIALGFLPPPGQWDDFLVNSTGVTMRRQDLSAGHTACRIMGHGWASGVYHGIQQLAQMGGNCGTPPEACRRMSCFEDSATYICAEKDRGVDAPCYDIANQLYQLVVACQCGPAGSLINAHYYSGDANVAYSLWAGYGHCWAKTGDERPTSFQHNGVGPICTSRDEV